MREQQPVDLHLERTNRLNAEILRRREVIAVLTVQLKARETELTALLKQRPTAIFKQKR